MIDLNSSIYGISGIGADIKAYNMIVADCGMVAIVITNGGNDNFLSLHNFKYFGLRTQLLFRPGIRIQKYTFINRLQILRRIRN